MTPALYLSGGDSAIIWGIAMSFDPVSCFYAPKLFALSIFFHDKFVSVQWGCGSLC